jgi:DNA-binding Lrp family transcriptional regulator
LMVTSTGKGLGATQPESLWPPQPLAGGVDRLDGALLREMFRGRHLWVGGVDPRQSAGELARRLGVNRTTVWYRLKEWKKCGFLVGFDVVPNPDLFGLRFGAGSIRIDNPVQKEAVIRDLGLISGIVGAQDMMGPWVVVLAACRNSAGFDRCSALLRRLAGVNETIPLVPFQCPASSAEPTPLDWKILRELRKPPTPLLAEVAKRLRISAKTAARHYDGLIRHQVAWYIPLLDYTRYAGLAMARFNVYLHPTAEPSRVLETIQKRYPDYVDIADRSDFALEPERKVKHVVVFLQLPAASASEDVQVELLRVPGVAEVEVLFPRRTFSYPDWISELIASLPG